MIHLDICLSGPVAALDTVTHMTISSCSSGLLVVSYGSALPLFRNPVGKDDAHLTFNTGWTLEMDNIADICFVDSLRCMLDCESRQDWRDPLTIPKAMVATMHWTLPCLKASCTPVFCWSDNLA